MKITYLSSCPTSYRVGQIIYLDELEEGEYAISQMTQWTYTLKDGIYYRKRSSRSKDAWSYSMLNGPTCIRDRKALKVKVAEAIS